MDESDDSYESDGTETQGSDAPASDEQYCKPINQRMYRSDQWRRSIGLCWAFFLNFMINVNK